MQLNANRVTIYLKDNDFGNKQAPIGDDDIASSVTLTGQAVIKQSNEIAKVFIKKLLNRDDVADPIVYNDTDSTYVTMKQAVDNLKIPILNEEGKIHEKYLELVEDLNNFLNVEIIKWGKKAFNSKDCRFVFKRESIADVGMFLQKKRYVLHVLNEEGIDCNKFKYTGVEVVRTTMPDAIKPYAKKIIETMLTTKSLKETNLIVDECYKKFKEVDIENVAFVMGLKGYDKYASQCKEFTTSKGMPVHVKSAYYHNLLLDKLGISDKHEKLMTGDKIRFLYVEKPNKYGIESIGFKYNFPKEFGAFFKPDYDLMFDKILFSMIERFYQCVNWAIRKPSDNVQTELFDLFA